MKKRKGAASYILAAILGSILMSILAVSAATINSSLFRGHEASNIALQTRILAETKYDILKNKGYNNLANERRAVINGSSYEQEVLLGSEYENDDGYKERDVTINVYKQGENDPRYSLPVTLSSQGSGNSVPIGTVIWFAASVPPDGYIECNGQSTGSYPKLAKIVGATVPDLRGVFIRGWDHGRGVNPGRNFGTLEDSLSNHLSQVKEVHSGPGRSNLIDIPENGVWSAWLVGGTAGGESSNSFRLSGTETRPRNVALLPCIKY